MSRHLIYLLKPSLPVETVSTFLNGPLRDIIETIYPSLLKLLNGNGSTYSTYKYPNIIKREKRRDYDKITIEEKIH